MSRYCKTSSMNSRFLTMACVVYNTFQIVMTLALDLRLMQGAWKDEGRECNVRVTFTLLGVRESVRE